MPSADPCPGRDQRAAIARAVIRGRTCWLAMSRRQRRSDAGAAICCGCSSNEQSGTAVIIATHDITRMDQYDARGGAASGTLHIYDRSGRRAWTVVVSQERPQVPARARNLSPIVRGPRSPAARWSRCRHLTFLARSPPHGAAGWRVGREWHRKSQAKSPSRCAPWPTRLINRDVAAVADAMRSQPGMSRSAFPRDGPPNCWNHGSARARARGPVPGARVYRRVAQPGTALDLRRLRGLVTLRRRRHRRRSPRLDRRLRSMTRRHRVRRHRHPRIGEFATIISVSFATRARWRQPPDRPKFCTSLARGTATSPTGFLRISALGLQGG